MYNNCYSLARVWAACDVTQRHLKLEFKSGNFEKL